MLDAYKMLPSLALLFAFSAIPFLSGACPGHIAAREAAANASSPFVLGSDGPSPPATLGYTINHFGLLTNDLDAMTSFYVDIIGLRHIFTVSSSERIPW